MVGIDYATQYYGDVKTIEHYTDFNTREPDYWAVHYKDRWTEAIKWLPTETLLAGPTLLDVGCGLGRSLEYFKYYGMKVSGIEPNFEAVKIAKAKGLNVEQGYIEDVKGSFDVIHIEQVLSHALNDKDILKQAKELLSANGVLIIEEPNDFNPLQRKLVGRLGEYWVTDDHVNYYDFDKMKELFEHVGFEVKHISATYPMELFELAGRHYVGDDQAGARLHKEVTAMLTQMGEVNRKKLLDGFAKSGFGRDLIFYCQKVSC